MQIHRVMHTYDIYTHPDYTKIYSTCSDVRQPTSSADLAGSIVCAR